MKNKQKEWHHAIKPFKKRKTGGGGGQLTIL
jgi:hypothetical protein